MGLSALPGLGCLFSFHVREVFNYDLFKYFIKPFLFFSNPYNSNVGMSNVVPEASEIVLISFHSFFFTLFGFPDRSVGKESACNAEDPGSFLSQEDLLEKGKATHSSILAWRITWTV